jgi:hypothetical protein
MNTSIFFYLEISQYESKKSQIVKIKDIILLSQIRRVIQSIMSSY